MRRAHRLALLAAPAALIALTACGPAPVDELEAVPEPDLSGVSDESRALFREERERLDSLLAQDAPDRRALAETFGRMGELAHAGERVEIAAAGYRNAQRLAPDDYRWPYYLGHLHRFSGNWDKSVSAFERALQLKPDDLPTLIHLAQLHLDRDEPTRAAALYRRAAELGDPSGAATFGLGLAAVAEEDFEAAAGYFEDVLARTPAASRVHYHLGVVYGRLGDRQRSESHLQQQGPGLPAPADRLMDEVAELKDVIQRRAIPGATAVAEGRTEDALTELRAAVEADPSDALAWLGLGTVRAREGRHEEAEQHLREALRVSTDRRVTQNAGLNLGNLLLETGRAGEAVDRYRALIALDPDSRYAGDARFRLVQALFGLGRAGETEADIRRLLSDERREAPLYLALAEGLARSGRYATARWVLEQGRQAHAGDARIANELARFLSTCPADEQRDGATALKLATSLFNAARNGPHAVTLAMALAENGRYGEAVDLQRRAIAEAERLGRTEILPQLRADLAAYESSQPVRR